MTLEIRKPSKFFKCEFQCWHSYTFQKVLPGHSSGFYTKLFVAGDFLAVPTMRAWGSVSSESRERLGRRLLGTGPPEGIS